MSILHHLLSENLMSYQRSAFFTEYLLAAKGGPKSKCHRRKCVHFDCIFLHFILSMSSKAYRGEHFSTILRFHPYKVLRFILGFWLYLEHLLARSCKVWYDRELVHNEYPVLGNYIQISNKFGIGERYYCFPPDLINCVQIYHYLKS